MKSKRGTGNDSRSVARAVAEAMRRLDRRAWTLVEYSDADWTHGYCAGDRLRAWKAGAKGLRAIAPPRLLKVPCAQFCARDGRVLVEHSVAEKSGAGAVYELKQDDGSPKLHLPPGGAKWKT